MPKRLLRKRLLRIRKRSSQSSHCSAFPRSWYTRFRSTLAYYSVWMKDEYKPLPWERVVSLQAPKATVEPIIPTAAAINKPGQNLRSRSACLWCVCVCRVRWARPSLGRLLQTRPPSRNTAAASLRNHQPQTAHPCRARQVAAPDRSLSVPLAKPFVRPFKLLRRCSRYCSSRGAKLRPAAAAAEGRETANPFFRPRRGAPSSLRSSAACLPIGADSAHTRPSR